jgi:hypothetical protein
MYIYVLQPGDESVYRYDFESMTTLRVRVLRMVPVVPRDRYIVLLGQNRRSHHVCRDRSKEAEFGYRARHTEKIQYYCAQCLFLNSINKEEFHT